MREYKEVSALTPLRPKVKVLLERVCVLQVIRVKLLSERSSRGSRDAVVVVVVVVGSERASSATHAETSKSGAVIGMADHRRRVAYAYGVVIW